MESGKKCIREMISKNQGDVRDGEKETSKESLEIASHSKANVFFILEK